MQFLILNFLKKSTHAEARDRALCVLLPAGVHYTDKTQPIRENSNYNYLKFDYYWKFISM